MPRGKPTKVYSAEGLKALRGKSDWERVAALTESDIARAVRDDPDAAPVDIDWSDAVVVQPSKQAISIRVDADVLAFFKRGGVGYQSRMNAVLRHFMMERLRKSRRG